MNPRTNRGVPLCPVDPAHGPLVDWPTDRWAFHCPSQRHDGKGDRPPTRAFFTTDEAEHGLAPRPAAEASSPGDAPPPAAATAAGPRPQLEAPVADASRTHPAVAVRSLPQPKDDQGANQVVGAMPGIPTTSTVPARPFPGGEADVQLRLALVAAP